MTVTHININSPNNISRLLTSKPNHSRGCKVMLTNGDVGRVQQIVGQSQQAAANVPDELRGLWD